MLLKRIQAPTLPEALRKVELECGKDALLVETRRTTRGYLIIAGKETQQILDKKPARTVRNERKSERWTPGFEALANKAQEFGLSNRVLTAIEKSLIGTSVHLDKPGDPAVPLITGRILKSLISIDTLDPPAARVTALVGTTGVGKTTTLAKLAAQCINDYGESTAIITIDTYRIAAVEQLRAFADMLGAPFEIAFTPLDLRRAVQRHSDKERIFVDTTGRSPFDRDAIQTLRGSLEGCGATVVQCLAAGTRRVDAAASIDGFKQLSPDALILTKWDETRVPGETLSVAIEQGIPLSHLTIGQQVPDDILPADPGALAANALSLNDQDAEALL